MSPVIGVILMVAITVILAAVMGTFVLDLGQETRDESPSASLSVESNRYGGASDTGSITISHRGGDGLNAERIRLVVTNESSGVESDWAVSAGTDVFSVGDEVVIDVSVTPNAMTGTAWGSRPGPDTDITGIQSGIRYTVTLIDVDSQRIIFEATVTA